MQKYKEINGNDYVKDSRTTINETMQSIQSMNSGTAFPTNNLFEGMKCYRTDLKKTYTLTDVENNTWVEDAHASLSDEATHAASATKLDTARSLNLGGAVTADAATFDGTANATINVKTLDATKLKGTASVSTTGNAATATKVVTTAASGASANIAEATMASNDFARIRVSGETNAGELALETADDGSEPIVARQYTGIYETPVRTAKILDESGNTSFPGTVVAPKFTGSLNGNAATATKLQTPRTLSLTGKASGSITFDGSANASINVTSVNADTAVADSNGVNIAANYVKKSVRLTTENLNDIHTPGLYFCDMDVNATTARNYPTGKASAVIVTKDGANGDDSCTQLCMPYVGNGIYKRQYDPTAYKWSTWRSVAFTDSNVASASKLAAARTISLTGNASGSASFDGSGDVSINASVNYAAASGRTQGSGRLAPYAKGVRPSNGLTMNYVYQNGYPTSFGNVINICGEGAGQLLAGWEGTDGALSHLYYRNLRDNGSGDWSAWGTIAYTSDIKNYAPTKTGNGASGTWGINISGNATSATTANSATKLANNGNRNNLANGAKPLSGLSVYQCYTHAEYPQQYGNVVSIGGLGDNELFLGWAEDARLLFRAKRDTQNNWTDWRAIAFTNEINNYAPTKTGGGASGTWGINISGNAASATTATTADNSNKLGGYPLNTKAVGGQYNTVPLVNVAGVMEIGKYIDWHATSDGTEDYSSRWTAENNGTVSVGTINGTLKGNADSATNADKVDGYHASDIINRISAANTGGIVAASLTENGYVKFANGLILQWGITDDKGKATFPIVFTKPMQVVTNIASGDEASHNNFDDDIDDSLTTTGFNCRYFKHRYICIGI
jgi:hypothetical protein